MVEVEGAMGGSALFSPRGHLRHFCGKTIPLLVHHQEPLKIVLVAHLGQSRVVAAEVEKGPTYNCPECGQEVILKKGRTVTHHFAHKPPVSCSFAQGETKMHLRAKELFYEFFKAKGLPVDIELPLASGKLRADVHITTTSGSSVVFELQHSSISPDEIERRTGHYFNTGVALTWIPLFKPWKLDWEPSGDDTGLIIKRYSPKPFERWLHGFNYGEIWYFDPENARLWKGKFDKYTIEVPVSEWYESGGNLVSVGGYDRISKRWKKLTLTGPFKLDEVTFKLKTRENARIGKYWYPGGQVVSISAQKT